MKPHTKIYIQAMGYYETDFMCCEVCYATAVDVHHIEARGLGGTTNPERDSIFNLQALCRDCHEKLGDKKKYKEYLKKTHMRFMLTKGSRLLGIFREVNYYDDRIELRA